MDFIVPLLEDLGMDFVKIGATFLDHLDQFDVMEKETKELTDRAAARFMEGMLNYANELICQNRKRKEAYDIQRHRQRTLITTAGDVTFTHSLFKDKKSGKSRYLLDRAIELPPHERFSAPAEAKALSEAEVYSYQHAADSLAIGAQTISKSAVKEKVHGLRNSFPEETEADKKKRVEYLYIEADEDHVPRQKDGEEKTGNFIGKLIYLFEGKEDVCKGRRCLIRPHYHGGLYQGSDENAALWNEVQRYIETHYDTEFLKCVYISGDGANWIKAGVDYVDRSVFVADRYHLMKYINRVSRLALNEEKWVKQRFYKYIYKNKLVAAKKLLTRIQNKSERDDVVEDVRTYLVGNWEAIHRAFRDKNVLGCSAEGHVSNVYADRMSSRPMGWSEDGCDAMCHLRCYVRNNGRGRIIDLVKYRRKLAMMDLEATGTEGIIEPAGVKRSYTKSQLITASYEERLRATIGGLTVRKTLAIREQIGNI